MASLFSESEQEWLDRRAEKMSAESGEPLPIARSKAMVQLVYMRSMPKAEVILFDPRRRRPRPASEGRR